MIKNNYYSTEISERIKSLIDNNLDISKCKNIYEGDFTILPMPDKLTEYLPAILINLNEQENIDANQSLDILFSPYYFDIYYLYPFDFKTNDDTNKIARKIAEEIANILYNYRTLDKFTIPKSESEAGGIVISSIVKSIKFENVESEFFRDISVPLSVIKMEYIVAFRTFSR